LAVFFRVLFLLYGSITCTRNSPGALGWAGWLAGWLGLEDTTGDEKKRQFLEEALSFACRRLLRLPTYLYIFNRRE
jgi:hypothetical protein